MPFELNQTLPDDFMPAQLAEFLRENFKVLNKVIGALLAKGEVTVASPIIMNLCQAAASMEAGAGTIGRPSQIAQPQIIPPHSKIRMN